MTAYSFLHKIFSWFVQGVFWCTIIGFSLLSADVSEQDSVTPIPETETKSAAEPYFPWEMGTVAVRQNSIDDIVLPLLASVTKRPLYLCSDEVFLRRAFLDIGGTIPNPVQIRRFLKEKNPRKREILIDMLLSSEAHIDYLSMKWCDLLRIKSEFPVRLWPNAVQAYYRWIRSAVKTNMSYDVFVRAQICASGSNFRDPPVNFLRAVENKEPVQIAAAVMLTFLGVRIEKWPAEKKKRRSRIFLPNRLQRHLGMEGRNCVLQPFRETFHGSGRHTGTPHVSGREKCFYSRGCRPTCSFFGVAHKRRKSMVCP